MVGLTGCNEFDLNTYCLILVHQEWQNDYHDDWTAPNEKQWEI